MPIRVLDMDHILCSTGLREGFLLGQEEYIGIAV